MQRDEMSNEIGRADSLCEELWGDVLSATSGGGGSCLSDAGEDGDDFGGE